jgi:hypothetical protein
MPAACPAHPLILDLISSYITYKDIGGTEEKRELSEDRKVSGMGCEPETLYMNTKAQIFGVILPQSHPDRT